MRIQKETWWEWTDGVCLANLTTGQTWDASYWTRQDWNEFCQHHEGNKWGQVENMIELTGEWHSLTPVEAGK
jgi:hypothetical protein